jgi:uracil-DNA glycosylase family 4
MNLSQTALFDKSEALSKSINTTNELGINWPEENFTFSSIADLEKTAKVCEKCSLCETRNNVVVHDGNPQAKLMFIGEGPGEQEDLQGVPFVGKAGQLLNKILESAKIDRQKETYICNIVKCRPPNNRVPLASEAAACSQYLLSQISIIRPKLIILLGSTSLIGVLGMKSPKITKLHGKWIEGEGSLLQGSLIMPFYHPSYLLRNPTKEVGGPKWQAWQAILEVRKKLTEIS